MTATTTIDTDPFEKPNNSEWSERDNKQKLVEQKVVPNGNKPIVVIRTGKGVCVIPVDASRRRQMW